MLSDKILINGFSNESMIIRIESRKNKTYKEQKEIFYMESKNKNIESYLSRLKFYTDKSNLIVSSFNVNYFKVYLHGNEIFSPLTTFEFILDFLQKDIRILCLQNFIFQGSGIETEYYEFYANLHNQGYILLEHKDKNGILGNAIIHKRQYQLKRNLHLKFEDSFSYAHIIKLQLTHNKTITIGNIYLSKSNQESILQQILSNTIFNSKDISILVSNFQKPVYNMLPNKIQYYLGMKENDNNIDKYHKIIEHKFICPQDYAKKYNISIPTSYNNQVMDYLGAKNTRILTGVIIPPLYKNIMLSDNSISCLKISME